MFLAAGLYVIIKSLTHLICPYTVEHDQQSQGRQAVVPKYRLYRKKMDGFQKPIHVNTNSCHAASVNLRNIHCFGE